MTPQEETQVKKSKRNIAIATALATFIGVGGCQEWRHNLHNTDMTINFQPNGQPAQISLKPHWGTYHSYNVYRHTDGSYNLRDFNTEQEAENRRRLGQ